MENENGKSFLQTGVDQTPQQIPGKQGRDLFPRFLAWHQVTGTICSQTAEPLSLTHLNSPLFNYTFCRDILVPVCISWDRLWFFNATRGKRNLSLRTDFLIFFSVFCNQDKQKPAFQSETKVCCFELPASRAEPRRDFFFPLKIQYLWKQRSVYIFYQLATGDITVQALLFLCATSWKLKYFTKLKLVSTRPFLLGLI